MMMAAVEGMLMMMQAEVKQITNQTIENKWVTFPFNGQ
jgi:hypothetical protein